MKIKISHEEFQQARRISRVIRKFLLETKMIDARSTDVYETLAREGLIEKDRHRGYHFRKFLHKLLDAGSLTELIPECRHTLNVKGENEWYFNLSTKVETSHPRHEVINPQGPVMKKEDIELLLAEEQQNVEKLPKDNTFPLTPQQLEIRKNYPRAYEIWTDEEIVIMNRVYSKCRNLNEVARLLKRQPHIVKEKLNGL